MTTTPTLRGAITALVTPMTSDGSLDEPTLVAMVERQLDAGINGLVPVGTTGESPTLSAEEDQRVIELTIETVRRRGLAGSVPVIAGTGSNVTQHAIEYTEAAARLGADAALVVSPYYNKPDQRMLEAHYRDVADVGLPVVVYNVPGRTGGNVSAATLLRLAEHPMIVAVKEASGNMEQIMTIVRDRPEGFAVLSGDDSFTLALMGVGGDGVISVASNEVPGVMVALCDAAARGDMDAAREIHYRYLDLMRVNFITTSPAPVKAAMAEMGLITDALRMPMMPLDAADRERVRTVLTELGLLGETTATGTTGTTTAAVTAGAAAA